MKPKDFFCLVFVGLFCLFGIYGNALGKTLYVGSGQTYTSIQSAVNAASAGDKIVIKSGTYSENVTINKSIEIGSESGYDYTTVVSKNGSNVFNIAADSVILRGLTIYGATFNSFYTSAIYLDKGSDRCTISGNRIGYDSSHNNYAGIFLNESSYSMISDNIIQSNSKQGIALYNYSGLGTTYNQILRNAISGSENGLYFAESNRNIISGNTISNNQIGLNLQVFDSYNDIYENSFSNNTTAIKIFQMSTFNNISRNTISSSVPQSYGVLLQGSELGGGASYLPGNVVAGNSIQSCENGIFLVYSRNCTLTNNSISSIHYAALELLSSDENYIFLNYFNNYGYVPYCESCGTNIYIRSSGISNSWQSPTKFLYKYQGVQRYGYMGNYFNNHSLIDSNGDGITDATYVIANDLQDDQYPLAANPNQYYNQSWWLQYDGKVSQYSQNQEQISAVIPGSQSMVWIAQQPAATNLTFSGSDSWSGRLIFTSPPPSNGIKIEIGYSTNGTDFVAGGVSSMLGNGSQQILNYSTNAQGFSVQSGQYLAIRITNFTGVANEILTGWGWSYASAPSLACSEASFYKDADGDGYGDPNDSIMGCTPPQNYVGNNSDCSDTDPDSHPGQAWYKDIDGDGYSDGTQNVESCLRPAGYYIANELIRISGDCDDTDKTIYPGTCGCGGSPDTDGDGIEDCADTDDDNDGMPDTWEIANGLNPLVNDANLDKDGDGFTNLREYRAGTNPNDPKSVPQKTNSMPWLPLLLE